MEMKRKTKIWGEDIGRYKEIFDGGAWKQEKTEVKCNHWFILNLMKRSAMENYWREKKEDNLKITNDCWIKMQNSNVENPCTKILDFGLPICKCVTMS